MARQIIEQEGTLTPGVASAALPIFEGAHSLTVHNWHASADMTLTTNGQVFTIKAGYERMLTGVEEYLSYTLLSASAVPYTVTITSGAASSSVGPNNVPAAGSITEALLEPASDPNVLNVERSFYAVLDVGPGIATGTTLFGPTLPANARVIRARCQVKIAFTGGAGATLGLGFVTDAVGGFRAAAILSDATTIDLTSATWQSTLAAGTVATDLQLAATPRQLAAVVGVSPLTAGKLAIHGTYVIQLP